RRRRRPEPWSAWRRRVSRQSAGKLPRAIVLVPIKGFGQDQALGGAQAERLDVGDEGQQASKLLAALDDAELGGLLDGICGVGAGICQTDDLGARTLGLQQEGREVLAREWMAHAAEHLAPGLLDHGRGVALKRMAE